MSKYDYPGERLFGARCEACDGPMFRDCDDSIWCPRCSERRMRQTMQKMRATTPKKGA